MNIGNTNVTANIYDSDDCLTLKTVKVEFTAWEMVIDVGGGWLGSPFIIDFTTLVEMGHIEGVQSVFIQGEMPEGLTLFVQGTGQIINLGATQPNQVIPVFSGTPPVFEIRVSPELYDNGPDEWLQQPDGQGRSIYKINLLFTNRKIYTR